MESRWGRRVGPGIAALAGILVIASTAVGAATAEGRPPPDCEVDASGTVGADTGSAWFRLEPTLVDGRRTGQRLEIGYGRGRGWGLDLDAESFATGPSDGRIVAATDDGTRSTVSLVDTRRGCATVLATTDDVVRSAVLAADGRTVYEHRVARADRRDLGIWRRVDDGTATPVLPPPDVDAAFGRTWLTTLHWSGRRLVVESCGEVACRVRELDPVSGAVRSISDPALGSLVGVAGDALVTRGACRGLPCPVLRADLATGEVTPLASAVGSAVMVLDGDRPVVVVNDVDGHGLRGLRLHGAPVPLADLDAALRLAPPSPEFGVELPPGWIPLLGPDGPLARRLDAATARHLDEVRP
jgi:hypothetical protein